jgi:hypothetical protein
MAPQDIEWIIKLALYVIAFYVIRTIYRFLKK